MRPVSAEDLVAAAAASALVGRACALADWLGIGRALTPAKVLRPADAAVAELGLDRPVLAMDGVDRVVDPLPFGRAVGARGPRARSAKHLPSLHPLWSGAVAADLIELRGQKVDGVDTALSATHELAQELEPLIQEMRQVFPGAGPVLGSLPDALRQGPVARVTPSGRDLLARLLRGQGLSVPTVGDLADTPPRELLLALSDHDPAAAADELRIWLDARGQDWAAALDDLVTSASGKDDEGPLRRAVLPVVIALAAQAAGSMIATWRQDPWLAVPVALGLAAASPTVQPEPAHLLWMAVDLLSTSLDDDDAFADLVDVSGIADVLAAPGAVAVAVGLDHPNTREVLRLLVDHVADRTLAKQLRRALTKGKPTRTPKTRPSATPLPGL